MRLRKYVVSVTFLGVLLFAGGISWAGQLPIDEAVKHAQEAIAHGKQGHGDQLVNHAETALKYAEAAQKEKANLHIEEGIKGLKDTVDQGKQGHADTATKTAEGALKHFLDVKDAPLDQKADGGERAKSLQEDPPRGLDPSGGY
jgi:hypothetical protein